MNLQQLEYIVALAKLQHFGKAADFCNISQPTLTMMVQKLEQEYDIRIFNRTRPISLTPLGEKLIGQAEIILKELGVFKDFIQEEKKHVAGYFEQVQD